MRIMIVDDEALSRIALKSLLAGRYNLVGEASCCEDALILARRTKPDVIFVDIIMPGPDGLDFIDRIACELPSCRFVVISNAEDMPYFQRAIRLKVFDYLAKRTIDEGALLDVLARLDEEVGQGSGSSSAATSGESRMNCGHAAFRDFLLEALDEAPDEDGLLRRMAECGVGINPRAYRVVILDPGTPSAKRDVGLFTEIGQAVLEDCGCGMVCRYREETLAVLFSVASPSVPIPEEIDEAEDRRRTQDLAYRLIRTAKRHFEIGLSAGISHRYTTLRELSAAFREAESAWERCFYTGAGSINFAHSLDPFVSEAAAAHLRQMARHFTRRNAIEDMFEAQTTIARFFDYALAHPYPARDLLTGLSVDMLMHVIGVFRNAFPDAEWNTEGVAIALVNTPTLQELRTRSLMLLDRVLNVTRASRDAEDIVGKIKRYVRQNIDCKLSLDEIAEHVYLNPAYLSRLFRSETGGMLSRFILIERVRKAKDYLLQGKSLRETAALVGFDSDSYFIKRFKSVVGETPGEYSRRNCGLSDSKCYSNGENHTI